MKEVSLKGRETGGKIQTNAVFVISGNRIPVNALLDTGAMRCNCSVNPVIVV